MSVVLRISMDPPLPPCCLDGSNPLLGQRLIDCSSQLKRIARDIRLYRIFRLNIKPEVIDWNLIPVHNGKQFANLRRDFASPARRLRSGAWTCQKKRNT